MYFPEKGCHFCLFLSDNLFQGSTLCLLEDCLFERQTFPSVKTRYLHRTPANPCKADRYCCCRNKLSALPSWKSTIVGWCGINPAHVLLLQKQIISYFKSVTSKHFFYIMAEPQFLLGAAAQWLDLVVLQDEIAVWAQ